MLVLMDADSGKVLQSFPISEGVDSSVFDPDSDTVFRSSRAWMIHVFHEDSADKLSALDPIETENGAKTMAIDPKTHNLFLSTSDLVLLRARRRGVRLFPARHTFSSTGNKRAGSDLQGRLGNRPALSDSPPAVLPEEHECL
jgi:hypothetical protein